MKLMVLAALAAVSGFIFAPQAKADITCSFYVASDKNDPNTEDKVFFEAPIVKSPSSDPTDLKRFTYVIVKADASSASLVTAEQVEIYKAQGAAAEAGNYLVSLQEIVTPNVYSIVVRKFDATTHWSDPQNWLATAYGSAPLFGLDVTTTKFSVVCETITRK